MMDFTLKATDKTPEIKFNCQDGELIILGRSIPEDSIGFYQPIFNWFDKYMTQPAEQTVLSIKLEYFNTSSSKCLLDIFKKLETISKQGNKVHIKWHYEADDEDMLEAGEDYNSIVELPFEFIEDK